MTAPRTMRADGVAMLALVAACQGDPAPCDGEGDAALELGRAQPGAFVPLPADAEVEIAEAPQGGYGVPVRVRTRGLHAATDTVADIVLELDLDGANAGHFELQGYPLLCERADIGGSFGTLVVPLDPDTFSSEASLGALDGRAALLRVNVRDDGDGEAEIEWPVTLRAP